MIARIFPTVLVVSLTLVTNANAQIIGLLVGNSSNFAGIDLYSAADGSYRGVFAGPGTGATSYHALTYGPDQNLYVGAFGSTNAVFKFNGLTGNFMSTFITGSGGNFTFGPNGDFFRIGLSDTGVLRYNGSTGQLISTFVSGLTGPAAIHFGPDGDLFVSDLNGIKRFNGTTGAALGNFIPPGSGGLTLVSDFLFTADGRLIVSGGSGGPNDKLLQFDGTSGAFVGVFAQGNGLNLPRGLAVGPDGELYAVSGGNSILEFNLTSGSFLGTFVPTTAHSQSNYLAFTPFPVPEPASIIYGCAIAGAAIGLQIRRSRIGANHSATADISANGALSC